MQFNNLWKYIYSCEHQLHLNTGHFITPKIFSCPPLPTFPCGTPMPSGTSIHFCHIAGSCLEFHVNGNIEYAIFFCLTSPAQHNIFEVHLCCCMLLYGVVCMVLYVYCMYVVVCMYQYSVLFYGQRTLQSIYHNFLSLHFLLDIFAIPALGYFE